MGVSEKVGKGGEAGEACTAPAVVDEAMPTAAQRRRVAVEIVRDHEALLRASALRVSICADDAEDAVQRGIEIMLAKAPTADARTLLPWARTVVRNEALAIRRSRERILARPTPDRDDDVGRERDWVAELPSESEEPSELVVRRERIERGREALAVLKPRELKALTQLAHGYSYAEIGAMNGWTRTKVNRCLAEGRARLRSVVRESEEGGRCALIEPLISACADGELADEEVKAIRNHLAVCGSCRATLREYRSIPSRVAAMAPAGPIGIELAPRGGLGRLFEWGEGAMAAAWTRVGNLIPGQDTGLGATLASGGMRGAGAAALAKLTAVCVGTAGGAAACVAVGILPSPVEGPERPPVVRAIEKRAEPARPRLEQLTAPQTVASEQPESRAESLKEESERPAATPPPEPPDPVATEFEPTGTPAVAASPPATRSAGAPAPRSGPVPGPTAVSGEFQP